MKISQLMMTMVAFSIAALAWAGDLAVDNLTVTKDATIIGNIYFSSTVDATGGTITTNGNYRIHTFTNVGTANFVVAGGSLTCDVLVVAGGGGANCGGGGGGGGGGVIITNIIVSGTNAVTVGQGGMKGIYLGYTQSNGSNSVFGALTAFGGGAGAPHGNWGQSGNGQNGGSGGGGGSLTSATTYGGTGTLSQGHNGGGNGGAKAGSYPGGGGGGAGTVGSNAVSTLIAGKGGDGIASSISGTTNYYGGGGGGGTYGSRDLPDGTPGAGGNGGGGAGANGEVDSTAGTVNTGGGGGGGGNHRNYGANGGSGIVIVRYPVTTSSNITTLSISSNGISQTSASGANVFMGKVGIGTANPAEKLHVVGNARVDGTNIVSAITLGNETRTNWPNVAVGALIASSNLSDVVNKAAARDNLGLGSVATNNTSAFVASNGDGSQLTNITAAQVGALGTNAGALIAANNLSDVANAGAARDNLGLGSAATNETSAFLSTTGGVVNGNLDVQGSLDIQYIPPKGDLGMGSYTNQ